MFDIGFWEIVLISVIGLIVLGPERLPIAIRSVMRWINTAKAMANSVKTEISQELQLHEMNEKMRQPSKQGGAAPAPELKQAAAPSEQDNPPAGTAKTAQNKQEKTDEQQ